MLLVGYNLLNTQNIAPYQSVNSAKWLVTGIPLTQLKELLKLHRKKNNNWPMVSFIRNRSEITTRNWAQLQNQKHKIQSNVFKITSFLNFKLQIIRLAQRALELYANSLKQLATFIIVAPMKNVEKCSCQFVDRKVLWVYCHEAKYYLCWIYQPGFYLISLHKIIMSKQHSLFIL